MVTGVGIIGAGVISRRYAASIASFDNLRLVAVADLNPAAADALASETGARAMSIEALLRAPDVDILANLTVPQAHTAVTRAALDAGKHVWSEKPVATSLAEARDLADHARARGLRLGCAPDTFLAGPHQMARRAIDSGMIGRVLSGIAIFMYPGPDYWHPAPESFFERGGGPVFDMGPYYVTALVNLLGPVRRVVAASAKAQATRTIRKGSRSGSAFPVNVPTHASAVLTFEGGALVTLVLSFDVGRHRHGGIELYGDRGSLALADPNLFEGEIQLGRIGHDWEVLPCDLPFRSGDHRGLGIVDMVQCMSEGIPHRASADLACHVVEVLEAIERGSRDGREALIESAVSRPARFDGLIEREPA